MDDGGMGRLCTTAAADAVHVDALLCSIPEGVECPHIEALRAVATAGGGMEDLGSVSGLDEGSSSSHEPTVSTQSLSISGPTGPPDGPTPSQPQLHAPTLHHSDPERFDESLASHDLISAPTPTSPAILEASPLKTISPDPHVDSPVPAGASPNGARQASPEKGVSQMEGVMLVLTNITEDWSASASDEDWKGLCTGCGMVGLSNTEVDDMVWFVVGKGDAQTAEVRRRTEQDTWLSNRPDVDWERTLYLNIIVNWHFELTVAVVDNETQHPLEWVTRRVYASPEQAVLRRDGDLKDIKYEKQYPNLYFNIEDWSDAFGDMRLSKGQHWAMEVSALASDKRRVHIVKGKLPYENVAKKFHVTAGAAKVGHSVKIPINTSEQDRCGEITVNVAPEEKAEEQDPVVGEKHAHNTIMRLASKVKKRVDGTFVKGRVAATTAPTLQCYLNFVSGDQGYLIENIKRLKSGSDDHWIKIPTASIQRSVSEAPADWQGQSFAPGVVNRSMVSPPRQREGTIIRKVREVRAECFLPQEISIDAPMDADAAELWRASFSTEKPLQLVDVLMNQVFFRGWVAKRGAKRIIARQAYKQRLCVITSKGLLYYFQDSEPQSTCRGTLYLRGVRMARRNRSALISATPYVLELHPCTPRRPGDAKDERVFHFAFATTHELEVFMKEVATFALLPP
eukprot:TRINITY_DN30105_c0_g1_i1.p1 TRINITY_DN30105_c0_g1~~TRINITY_DN30105_c0_g1_i1.p1  ORF type:complete len:696 (+),score=202.84 TRINITY_DN30105_c0_g1_i1:46-2088(+)